MGNNSTYRRDSGIVVRIMSAIVFMAFSFLWLFSFQADIMAYTQHVYSGGQTHYNAILGPLLITTALWVIQLIVYAVIRLRNSFHALTYFPSMLVLGLLGTLSPTADGHSPLTFWLLLIVPMTLLWLFAVYVASMFAKLERKHAFTFFSRSMWVNMLILAVMMVCVAFASNTNAVFHHRARMETHLLNNRFDEALLVGRKSLESDPSLTMLRAYALSRQGQLGEHLFEYPVAGNGADLVPLVGNKSRLLRYPVDSLYRHLGAIPRPGMTTSEYLERMLRHGQATKAVADYVLCGQLIDRNLDAFARTVTRYYEVADSLPLPRHYREALTLYTHLRSHPVLVYHDTVTDEDYADLQTLEAQYTNPSERHIRVKEKYQGSYWYYYEYLK